MLTAALAAPAIARQAKTVLVVHTYGYDAPGRTAFDDSFARKLRELTGGTADLYIETLDTNRLLGEDQAQTRAHLREKYAGKKFDVVVAVYGLALNFLVDGDPPFPGVPIAATLTRRPASVPPGVALTWSGNAIRDTLKTALQLHPDATQIAVIDSGPVRTARDLLAREISAQVDAVRGSTPVIVFRDLSLAELLPRVQALPPDTVILFMRQFLGLKREPIANPEAVRQIAAVAPGPVYVTTDQVIGTGAAGGVVLNFEHVGTTLAELAVRVAEHGPAVPPIEDKLSPTFDWRALQRWNINEARLPAGSVVLFREYTFWDQYRWYVLIAVAIVAIQSALILGLIVQGARRRRTERALRDNERQLRHAYDRNRDLAGRLINAQEAERARIARDLHDDVSQQLAGLGIMMSGLKHGLSKQQPPADLGATVVNLQSRTAALAQSIRAVSHELHPSVLQDAGLEAALRRHCAEFEQLHNIRVSFAGTDDLKTVGSARALCLFRVTQEALANTARHARATHVRVTLSRADDGVVLDIADDGIGFVAAERDRHGLGLRSIDERVRLCGGEVTIESRPGAGTTLRVAVPLDETAAV